jgi:cation diffusion facilitator CzcD-associated flavoprotein CzcO
MSQGEDPCVLIGCHSVTPGHHYLEALTEDNALVVTEPIYEIVAEGIITKDPKTSATTLHKVDIIITATGYDTSFVPRFPIIGLHRVDLRTKWEKEGASAYMSVAVPSYPNYFSAYTSQDKE